MVQSPSFAAPTSSFHRMRIALLLVALGAGGLPVATAEAHGPGAQRSGTVKRAVKAPRPNLRIRALQRMRPGNAARTQYIAERHWDRFPGVRRGMSRFLGQEGRTVRHSDFDVSAIYNGLELIGYSIHAAATHYDGTVHESVLEVDTAGAIVKQAQHPHASSNAVSRVVRTFGRGRAATTVRNDRVASIGRSIPGANLYRRVRTQQISEKRALVDAYEREHGVTFELDNQAADTHVRDVMDYSRHQDSWVFGLSDLHANSGPQNPNEDFRAGGSAMVKFMKHVNDGGNRRATMVCGGDCFEFMENAPFDATNAELKAFATSFVEGHAETYKALAGAVVPRIPGKPDRGLRVLFVRGNHDMQMVTKEIRAHVIDEIIRVGGLNPTDAKVFKQRVAYAGDMAVLGKKGEWVMVHGDQADPANNWRENPNPFRYKFSRGGPMAVLKTLVTTGKLPRLTVDRVRENNMGYTIVQKFFRHLEARMPGVENAGTAHSMGMGILTHPRNILRLGRVMWSLLGGQKRLDPDTLEATRRNDYEVALAWAERTGIHEQWGLSGPEEVVARLDTIMSQMPKPVHERMTSPLRTINLLRMVFGEGRRIARERAHAEPLLVELYTSELPNVVDVNIGHTHDQSRVEGVVPGRGRVTYRNTGTWTTAKGEDVFTVAVSRHEGGVLAEKGLWRVDQKTGQLVKQDAPPEPGWGRPDGWQAPASADDAPPATAKLAAGM
jgi:UDP-2,3-diacylglucosamine pyrophosphatase LpxH